MSRHIQKVVFCFFESLQVTYYVRQVSKYDWGNFTPTTCQQLGCQNVTVGIGSVELCDPFDTLNYKPFFKYCISQTISHVFLSFVLVWSKIICFKT